MLPCRVEQVPRNRLREIAVGLLDEQAVAEVEHVAVEGKCALKVKAWGVGPKRSRCHSRDSPSLIVGMVPAGIHHSAMYAPSKRSNQLRRCDMIGVWDER